MGNTKNIQARVSIVSQDDEQILRIDKKKLSLILSDSLAYFMIGAVVGSVIGFLPMLVLGEIEGFPPFIPL